MRVGKNAQKPVSSRLQEEEQKVDAMPRGGPAKPLGAVPLANLQGEAAPVAPASRSTGIFSLTGGWLALMESRVLARLGAVARFRGVSPATRSGLTVAARTPFGSGAADHARTGFRVRGCRGRWWRVPDAEVERSLSGAGVRCGGCRRGWSPVSVTVVPHPSLSALRRAPWWWGPWRLGRWRHPRGE